MSELKKITFTRKQLYEMVWSEPLSRLAKKYSISDNGIRKACKRMNIPLPKNGHWQKIQYGKKVINAKLSKSSRGESEITLYLRDKDGKYVNPTVSPLKLLTLEIENDKSLQLTVPLRLSNPDIIVQHIQSELLERKTSGYLNRGLIAYPNKPQTIKVSPANISRALRFFDALIKLLRARGHEFSENYRGTCVVIFGESINISIIEKVKVTKTYDKYFSNNYQPTGLLAFRCGDYSLKEWKDGKLKIEERLAEFLAYLEFKGAKEHDERIERDKYWAKIEEEERIQKDLEDRKEKELKDFNNLISQAVRWRKTMDIREYISAFEKDAVQRGVIDDDLTKWLNWANKKADWYDPFVRAHDELLGQFQ